MLSWFFVCKEDWSVTLFRIFQVPNLKEREYLSSSTWGSFLVDDVTNVDHKLEATMYGILVRKYADLVIPQISYIAGRYIFRFHF